ncbi:hypothetical protein FRC12_004965 [Ceratobasidium sp. 428]|nr:hypothetical protein FRC12_004965 [Ceratobasidium sp. 428]
MLFSTHSILTALIAYSVLFYGVWAAPGPIAAAESTHDSLRLISYMPRAEPPRSVPTNRAECEKQAEEDCKAVGENNESICLDMADYACREAFPN